MKFLVERSPSGLSTQFQTIHKERPAWEALASCVVTEHTPAEDDFRIEDEVAKMIAKLGHAQVDVEWVSVTNTLIKLKETVESPTNVSNHGMEKWSLDETVWV